MFLVLRDLELGSETAPVGTALGLARRTLLSSGSWGQNCPRDVSGSRKGSSSSRAKEQRHEKVTLTRSHCVCTHQPPGNRAIHSTLASWMGGVSSGTPHLYISDFLAGMEELEPSRLRVEATTSARVQEGQGWGYVSK